MSYAYMLSIISGQDLVRTFSFVIHPSLRFGAEAFVLWKLLYAVTYKQDIAFTFWLLFIAIILLWVLT